MLEKSCKLVIGRSVFFYTLLKGGDLHAALLVNLYFTTNIITCKVKHPPGTVDEKIVQDGRQSLVFVLRDAELCKVAFCQTRSILSNMNGYSGWLLAKYDL